MPRSISGVLRVSDFEVAAGEVVIVTDDVRIEAAGRVDISGTLRALDRGPSSESVNGMSIDIVADRVICISGRVDGGSGRDGKSAGVRGGNGSTVSLMAPLILIDGEVHGGPGGASAPGLKGGLGGSVHTYGGYFTRDRASHPTAGIYGGTGGTAGVSLRFQPGEGGDGGDAIAHESPFPPDLTGESPLFASIDSSLNPTACPGGSEGFAGGWAIGGSGHAGASGTPGQVCDCETGCEMNGGEGGKGGLGGMAIGYIGHVGGPGANCCPRVGGAGGTGGIGGIGFGGFGGPGGPGGSAGACYTYGHDVCMPPFLGRPGPGGRGGPGGDGYGGIGGTGGNGGSRLGAGGSGGAGGEGRVGPGGSGGSGQPAGLQGAPGHAYMGADGNVGCIGDYCE